MKKAVVIGAGIGGLAVAIRLARQGMHVSVFESSDQPGGKISQITHNGFRFDTGPSLFTLPELTLELLDEEFKFQVRQLPVITKYFWPDSTTLNAFSDVEELSNEVSLKTELDSRRLKKYLTETNKIYDIIAPVFIFNTLHKIRELFKLQNIPALFNLHRLKAFNSLHSYNQKKLGNKYVVQLFDRYATYNGSNPYQTPATLRVIAHLEHNLGAWLPEGGMFSIVNSMFGQAQKLGIDFYFNEQVLKVNTIKGKVTGITTVKGVETTDVVVSNIDINRFYTGLMPDKKQILKLEKQQRSSSALIFYWGINGVFPELDVHNIFFSGDYENEFRDLFVKKTISADPTVYVYISSKIFNTDAPKGCQNFFVMVNAPENIGQNWSELIAETRRNILAKMHKALNVNLSEVIIFEEVLSPVSVEMRTGSFHGSLYGPSSNSRMSAFQRHPNFSSRTKGLYFTGGSVHPGGGIPLCLSSAKIAAKLIKRDMQ